MTTLAAQSAVLHVLVPCRGRGHVSLHPPMTTLAAQNAVLYMLGLVAARDSPACAHLSQWRP